MDGLCLDDLDEFGRELDDPYQELVQDVVHLLLEPYGSNPDVLTRGVGLTQRLSGPAAALNTVRAQVEAQLHDDERITSATCVITATDTRGTYRLDLTLILADGVTLTPSLVVDGNGGVRRVGG